jgi:hypothetical protein
MMTWLKNDLAANPNRCTLAYFHKPLFSSGYSRGNPVVRPLWDALDAAHADVVISGHDHVYKRFARQTPSGAKSERGIGEFVVGTGGAELGGLNYTAQSGAQRQHLRSPEAEASPDQLRVEVRARGGQNLHGLGHH